MNQKIKGLRGGGGERNTRHIGNLINKMSACVQRDLGNILKTHKDFLSKSNKGWEGPNDSIKDRA